MSDRAVVIIGKGTVGSALLRQIADIAGARHMRVALVAGRTSYVAEAEGLSPGMLGRIAEGGFDGLPSLPYASWEALEVAVAAFGARPIMVDLTSSEAGKAHRRWQERGWEIVTANKKPLSASQALFDVLLGSGGPAYRHETTVGAGLPVISTIEALHASGDRLTGFSGMLSGTMGAIFSACDQGSGFADAVTDAKSRGYTEPDPRDDLSGADVARKALILGRLMGLRLEPEDIEAESLVPESLRHVSLEAFMDGLKKASRPMTERVERARSAGRAIRYLAEGDADGIRIGPVEVGPAHPAFGLAGPENLVVLRTQRYDAIPITIRGPGAGAEVTAAGVLSDIIRIETSL